MKFLQFALLTGSLTACIQEKHVSIGLLAAPEQGLERDVQVVLQLNNKIVANQIIPAGSIEMVLTKVPYKVEGYKAKASFSFLNDHSSVNSVEFVAKEPYPSAYIVAAGSKNGLLELRCEGQFFPKEMQGICAPAKSK